MSTGLDCELGTRLGVSFDGARCSTQIIKVIGVDFTAWDEHVKRVLQNGRKKIGQVHSNRDIDL